MSSKSGWMADDFPELFAPASSVRGRIASRVSSRNDLNPRRTIAVSDGRAVTFAAPFVRVARAGFVFVRFATLRSAPGG